MHSEGTTQVLHYALKKLTLGVLLSSESRLTPLRELIPSWERSEKNAVLKST